MTLETKLQIEMLKLLEDKHSASWYAEDKKYIYITTNGIYGIRIPKNKFFLNCDYMKPMPMLISNFIPDRTDKLHRLTITDEKLDMVIGTGTILRCSQFDTCINSKILKKIFKKKCRLYSKDSKSPVYFVLKDEIYAVVMPIDMSKKDRNHVEV